MLTDPEGLGAGVGDFDGLGDAVGVDVGPLDGEAVGDAVSLGEGLGDTKGCQALPGPSPSMVCRSHCVLGVVARAAFMASRQIGPGRRDPKSWLKY